MSTVGWLWWLRKPDMIQPMVDIDKKARGARIAQAITDSGKTQREMSEIIGVAPQSITKWIRNGNISMDNLVALSDFTGIDLRYLISGDNFGEVAEEDMRYTVEYNSLRDIVGQLDQPQMNKLLMCARAISESTDSDVEDKISIGTKEI